MNDFIPPLPIKIKTLKSEIPAIFEHIMKKHNVKRSDISIKCDLSAIYIYEVKYCGLSGKDDENLLEIIEL